MHKSISGLWNGKILEFQTLPSTNRWAMENISHCSHGDVVWAHMQTDGKGRFDRKWISAKDHGLTVSVCMDTGRFPVHIEPLITQITAISVQRAISGLGIAAALKWPNDVLACGRKIAGILLEKDNASGFIIAGIGINVNQNACEIESIPAPQQPTSMLLEKGHEYAVIDILNHILRHLESALNEAEIQKNFVVENWKACDYLLGKDITIQSADGTTKGQYAGIGGSGQLMLKQTSSGENLSFWAGDVTIAASHLPPDTRPLLRPASIISA